MTKHVVTLCLVLLVVAAASGKSRGEDAPEGNPSIEDIVKGWRLRAEGRYGPRSGERQSARFLNWNKNNYVGTSWTFMPKRYVVTELNGGIFLQGDLISPRGGTTDRNVFVLFDEWDCGS